MEPIASGREYNAEPSADLCSVLESRKESSCLCSFSILAEKAKRTQYDGLV